MILLAKLSLSAWLFILAYGELRLNRITPSSKLARKGVCSILECIADNMKPCMVSYLESLTVFNKSQDGSKTVLGTVSGFQNRYSSDCLPYRKVDVYGHFTLHMATMTVTISDKWACKSSEITCELRYISPNVTGHVINGVFEVTQRSHTDISDVMVVGTYVHEILPTLETDLGGAMDRMEKECDTTAGFLPRYRTCDKPSTSLPREEVTLPAGISVLCDTQTDGGNWIIFQRRVHGNVHFNRSWADYKDGFGDLFGDFWLGNENLLKLTSSKAYRLRIDFRLGNGTDYYAEYSSFRLEVESLGYKLKLGPYEKGTAPDEMKYNNDQMFSAFDKDNDQDSKNCAASFNQGFWFNRCSHVGLKGAFNGKTSSEGAKLFWPSVSSETNPIVFTEMKLRQIR